MRILITIPHFFNPAGNGQYASAQPNPQPRIHAFTQCLRNLQMLYVSPHEIWYRDGERLLAGPANQDSRIEIDIIVCTCRDLHLLDKIQMPPNSYEHQAFDCEPMELGFECHDVLAERLGDYDCYGYMEDDLILHDPAFFTKIAWFQGIAGEQAVLQPNRFERYVSEKQLKKVYIDFEFAPEAEVVARPVEPIVVESFGESIQLRGTTNAHSGCFFLSAAQMAHWANQETFGSRDASYVGPLESAATLGLIRNFQVYKPAPRSAHFLEVEHYGQMWSRRLAAVCFAPPSKVVDDATGRCLSRCLRQLRRITARFDAFLPRLMVRLIVSVVHRQLFVGELRNRQWRCTQVPPRKNEVVDSRLAEH